MLASIGKYVRRGGQAVALAFLGFAVACVVNLNVGAQQAVPRPIFQPEPISVSSTVDRSHKGNRLPLLSPEAERKTFPGCERPFSPLAKGTPSIFNGRCVT